MIEDSRNSDFGSLVKVFLADFREAVEAGYFDPAGFLLACPECQVETCDGLPLRVEVYVGVISQVAG
jgi:hypothetical protein